MSMESLEKLRILLPHWIEHNKSHEAEYSKWAAVIRNEGNSEVSEHIEKAIVSLRQADAALNEALGKVGGPLKDDHHHH
ncbi:hypothetical protein ACFL6N_05125 [Thermodesulfobacteriota bacterium]